MSTSYRDEAEGVFAINVTPLVDVVLVLLIIFMVTAPAIAKRGISFEEPKTVSGSQVESKLQITLDENRVLYVNGQKFEPAERARPLLEAKLAENPEIKAVITADKSVPHGDVMAAVDLIKVVGIKKFAFTARRKADAP